VPFRIAKATPYNTSFNFRKEKNIIKIINGSEQCFFLFLFLNLCHLTRVRGQKMKSNHSCILTLSIRFSFKQKKKILVVSTVVCMCDVVVWVT